MAPLEEAGEIASAPTPLEWTPDHVARRLIEAFRTLERMPRVRGPRQPGGHWPGHRLEWADQLAQAELPDQEKRERAEWRNRVNLTPSSREIAHMDASLDWVRELRTIDAAMALVLSLWALRTARRRSLRGLCREKGWAPHTFYRVRTKALATIATSLNERLTPVF